MALFKNLIPDANNLVSMHISELSGYLLEYLLADIGGGNWNRRNCCMNISGEYGDRIYGANKEVGVAISTAWAWLESNGLICRHPEQDYEWFVPTRRAGETSDRKALKTIISNQQLPEEFLHPALLINARPLYLQSRFDTAVFEAFKLLEVTIRSHAGLGNDLIGVQLASRAFHPESGELTDMTSEKGERSALMSLMTGALGSYKNATSHRHLTISSEEARDMIMLASHLLKIVDARKATSAKSSDN